MSGGIPATVLKKAFEIIRTELSQYDKYKNGTNIDFEVMINNINVHSVAGGTPDIVRKQHKYFPWLVKPLRPLAMVSSLTRYTHLSYLVI